MMHSKAQYLTAECGVHDDGEPCQEHAQQAEDVHDRFALERHIYIHVKRVWSFPLVNPVAVKIPHNTKHHCIIYIRDRC